MAPIFHIALAADWENARTTGSYTVSTRGRSLAEVGFIHCSRGDQWPRVREAVYADATEPLVLLQVDPARLDVPVVEEPGEPGSTETFPHVYGPLPVDAVVKEIPLEEGSRQARPASAARPASPAPAPSFARIFFTEMFGNMALVLLIMATTAIGLLVGTTFDGDVPPVVGAGIGLVAGGVLARLLYVRRQARAG